MPHPDTEKLANHKPTQNHTPRDNWVKSEEDPNIEGPDAIVNAHKGPSKDLETTLSDRRATAANQKAAELAGETFAPDPQPDPLTGRLDDTTGLVDAGMANPQQKTVDQHDLQNRGAQDAFHGPESRARRPDPSTDANRFSNFDNKAESSSTVSKEENKEAIKNAQDKVQTPTSGTTAAQKK